jgi:hypothetical protein
MELFIMISTAKIYNLRAYFHGAWINKSFYTNGLSLSVDACLHSTSGDIFWSERFAALNESTSASFARDGRC